MISATKSQKRRKWFLKLLILTVLLALLFFAVKERKELLIRESTRILESAVSRGADLDIHIGHIRGNIFGMIAFDDLEIRQASMSVDQSLLFKAKSIVFQYSFMDIISKNTHSKLTISFKKPEIFWHPRVGLRKTRFRFMEWLKDWLVSQKNRIRVEIEGMNLSIGNPPMKFEGVDISFVDDSFELQLPVSHMNLNGADFSTVLRASGHFESGDRFDSNSFVGQFKTEGTVVDWKPMSRESSFDFSFSSEKFEIHSTDLLGGVHLDGKVDFLEDFALDLQLKATNFPLSNVAEFLNADKHMTQSGSVDLDLRFSGSPWAPAVDAHVSIYDGWVSERRFKSMVINATGAYPLVRLTGSRMILEDGSSMKIPDASLEVKDLFKGHTYRALVAGGSAQETVVTENWEFSRPKDFNDKTEFVMEHSLSDGAKVRFRKFNQDESDVLNEDPEKQKVEVGFEYRLLGQESIKVDVRQDEEIVGVEHKMKF